MKIRVLKLGTVCSDKATELTGTLTHWIVDMGKGVKYIFQPKGLNDEGFPVKKLILEEARLNVKTEDFEEVDIPFEILGTNVTDKATGFTGMGVEFVRHINGCFHVCIQPKGILEKTKTHVGKCEFDLRGCTGPKIIELSEKELRESQEKEPSPTGNVVGFELPHNLA